MNYVVDVVDTTDTRLSEEVLSEIKSKEPGTKIVLIPPVLNAVDYMCRQILTRTTDREINVLRIWGHGHNGLQNVAAGDSDGGWRTNGSIDISHFEQSESPLATLRPRFYSRKSRIEMRGCCVAGGTAGPAMMLKVARTVGVRVMAGWDFQCSMNWINTVYQADPDGGFKQVYYTASTIYIPPSRS
jgi:hypothetical protein